jgi:hypothetical protein
MYRRHSIGDDPSSIPDTAQLVSPCCHKFVLVVQFIGFWNCGWVASRLAFEAGSSSQIDVQKQFQFVIASMLQTSCHECKRIHCHEAVALGTPSTTASCTPSPLTDPVVAAAPLTLKVVPAISAAANSAGPGPRRGRMCKQRALAESSEAPCAKAAKTTTVPLLSADIVDGHSGPSQVVAAAPVPSAPRAPMVSERPRAANARAVPRPVTSGGGAATEAEATARVPWDFATDVPGDVQWWVVPVQETAVRAHCHIASRHP